MMMKTTIIFAAALAFGMNAGAQSINDILKSVEQNNKELQAMNERGKAQALDIDAQNNLNDPSIEYSPFSQKA